MTVEGGRRMAVQLPPLTPFQTGSELMVASGSLEAYLGQCRPLRGLRKLQAITPRLKKQSAYSAQVGL